MGSAEDRFWSKVDIGESNECWRRLAYTDRDGYGRFWLGGKKRYAHRVAWILTYGEIPEGMLVCHHCDNPACCNLAHLFLGTDADNAADKTSKGRQVSLRGEDNGHSKLAEADVLEIRRLRSETDLYQREIARMFGVTRSTVSAIVHGRLWHWLQRPTPPVEPET